MNRRTNEYVVHIPMFVDDYYTSVEHNLHNIPHVTTTPQHI